MRKPPSSYLPDLPRPGRDSRAELVAMIYFLGSSLRSLFVRPRTKTGLVQLEALSLGMIVTAQETLTVSEIGRALAYPRQSIQRAVNSLVENGLVEALPNPNHKRAPMFAATEKGCERMKIAQEPVDELGQALAKEFDEARVLKLLSELTALRQAIDSYYDPNTEIEEDE